MLIPLKALAEQASLVLVLATCFTILHQLSVHAARLPFSCNIFNPFHLHVSLTVVLSSLFTSFQNGTSLSHQMGSSLWLSVKPSYRKASMRVFNVQQNILHTTLMVTWPAFVHKNKNCAWDSGACIYLRYLPLRHIEGVNHRPMAMTLRVVSIMLELHVPCGHE